MYDGYEGIKEDRYGVRAYVKIGTGATARQKEKRFKRNTPLKTILNWQESTRVALRGGTVAAPKDTLRNDAVRYLAHMKAQLLPSGYASLVCEINAWEELFDVPRHKITRAMLLDIRHRWLTEPRGGPTAKSGTRDARPIAPKTCNHRIRALRALYHYIDGSKAETPCDDIDKLREPDANPKFVSVRKIREVAARLTDPKTRARFMVLASTGQRPAQLKRAQPDDVDLRRRVWFVRPAKGGNPIPIVLTDDMVIAWKAFKAADAWSEFREDGTIKRTWDSSDYAKELYAAGWPKGVRPYNTKHTVAITLGESGVEWEDMKDWFGQKDVKTTRIYTGHILARTRGTAKRLDGRIGWKLRA
jgi:integrase